VVLHRLSFTLDLLLNLRNKTVELDVNFKERIPFGDRSHRKLLPVIGLPALGGAVS
jgi:hypothetical protein